MNSRTNAIIIAITLLVSGGCASVFEPAPRPIEILCGGSVSCVVMVRSAEEQRFVTMDDAVRFGLAYLHDQHPHQESAGAVYVHEEGYYYFEEAGLGDRRKVGVLVRPDTVAWFHTHIIGNHHCSAPDENSTYWVNRLYKRKIHSYVQHRNGRISECKPVRYRDLPRPVSQ